MEGKTVRLTKVYTSWEAHLIEGRLKDAGIPCVLHNENMTTIFGNMVSDFTGIDILVFEDQLEEAKAIMRDNG